MNTAQEKINTLAKKNGSAGALQLRDLLEAQKREIARALPKHLDADRFVRLAWTATRSSPKLLECSPLSIASSVMEAAQLGLEIDGVIGHGYLVPYRNKRTRQPEAQFQIGTRGFILLADQGCGAICDAEVVCEGDAFEEYRGTTDYLRHSKALRNRGLPYAVWAKAMIPRDGGLVIPKYIIMSAEEVEKVMRVSKSAGYDDSPWKEWPDEMWKKTAIRRLCKQLPLRPQALQAVVQDEYREVGAFHASDDQLLPVAEASPAEGAGGSDVQGG